MCHVAESSEGWLVDLIPSTAGKFVVPLGEAIDSSRCAADVTDRSPPEANLSLFNWVR